MKFLKNLVINFLLAALFTSAILPHVAPDADPLTVSAWMVGSFAVITAFAIILFGHKMEMPKGSKSRYAYMAVQKEIWTDFMVENLFKANRFLQYCFRADQFVLAGKIVHIPVAGSKANVVKNRSSLPATIAQRTDTDITYALDEFTTDPILITNADQVELEYDKIANVMTDHQQGLEELVGDDILIKWCSSTGGSTTTATIIRTTGGAVPAHMPSATGNRKKFIKEDLKAAQTQLNKNNVPKEDRYAIASSEMISQLQEDPDLVKRDFGKELDLPEGAIGKLYGFWIIDRSYVVTYNNTPAVKALGAAAAATDNDAVICYQKNQVEAALGEVKFFENLDSPENYGDVYSGLLRAGGRIRRATGVVVIVQDASA